MGTDAVFAGRAWQLGIWDTMAPISEHEVGHRCKAVVDNVIARARLADGQQVLDLGTGTGSVALQAAPLVLPGGHVTGIDISTAMLATATQHQASAGITNVSFREGGAKAIPAPDGAFDVVLAWLSLMYVIDRAVAAREIARVLRPEGQLVAAMWGGPEQCDLVRFQ